MDRSSCDFQGFDGSGSSGPGDSRRKILGAEALSPGLEADLPGLYRSQVSFLLVAGHALGTRGHVSLGVDVFAVELEPEIQARPCGTSGGAHLADDRALRHGLSR